MIPVGGIAWAGDRGISKVEVSVDGGDWVEAELRDPLSTETWVIWRYNWPFASGSHTFAVRCYDGNGDDADHRRQSAASQRRDRHRQRQRDVYGSRLPLTSLNTPSATT